MQHSMAEGDLKVAVPQFEGNVAPCFEVAGNMLIAVIEGNTVVSAKSVACTGPEGYRRVRLLQVHRVSALICNGIKRIYRDMLVASGLQVYGGITSTVDEALLKFAAGKIAEETRVEDEPSKPCSVPHQDIVYWASTLFESHGYSVSPAPDQGEHLVDLIAEIKCPVCGGRVKVAICCGAHTYRATQEITEFHHATPLDYNARVFVCPTNPAIAKCCNEYGIELINPDFEGVEWRVVPTGKLPILEGPVRNHEKASRS